MTDNKDKTLTLISAKHLMVILQSEGVKEFQRCFSYLEDENGNIEVFQRIDEKFLNKLTEFNVDVVDEDQRRDFLHIFELGKHFSMQFNISYFAFMQSLHDHVDLLTIMDNTKQDVRTAIETLNKMRFDKLNEKFNKADTPTLT